ncbi:MAG: hypothetical protein QCI38_04325, partial [Candidatus Thermoplasmatota archaeon]|nr:hypothetical protein [Candidatus Thermoplasmatota archaeon]
MDRKRPGQTYERFCMAMGEDKQGLDPSIRVGKAERKHMARIHHIQLGLDEARRRNGSQSAKKMERLMVQEKNRYEKEKRKILQLDFHEATQYLGMKVSPEQALKAAFIVSASSFFSFLVAYVSLTIFHPLLMKSLQNFLLPMGLSLPILLFGFMASYPEILAKRIRTASLGKTPEPINYMTMSLRTSPSLERAVAFAAEHCEEPMSTNLRRVIWEVALRKHYSVEDSLTEFAYRWGRWNDDFKRALYVIRGAVLEKTREGFERSLDKAHAIALSGAKEKVEEFASRLSGPATILFALGVVLPLLIGAAIPMQNMQMPTNMAYEQTPEPDMASPAILVMAMNKLFP